MKLGRKRNEWKLVEIITEESWLELVGKNPLIRQGLKRRLFMTQASARLDPVVAHINCCSLL